MLEMKNNVIVACLLALCAAQAFAANTHTVTFRKMDGTVFQTIQVAHGANATSLKPAVPAESGMTDNGWDCVEKLANVTNDVTCWALYEASTAKSPSTSIASQSVVDRETPYSLDEYFQIYNNLAWSDEFSGNSLSVASSSWFSNGKNWLYDTEQRNSELQKYTTTGGNHIVSDGTLKLRAKRESSGGKSFTSGSIRSQGTVAFRYGRCEIRAKLTKQKGTWPAFWLMGTSGNWPNCGELDVFEQINGSDWIGGNMHIPDGAGATFSNSGLASTEDGTHWGDAFHRIGVIMTEFECVWYVDDHIFKRMDVRNKTRYPMTDGKSWYILLNLAFGGGWPGQTSADDASIAGFQSEDFEIDYCRIFTNTTAGNTVSRGLEPEVARLSGPVKATVWRGWQMKYGKAGANYFQNHLIGEVGKHIKTAMREYFTRDGADIVTFLTRPDENTGSTNLANPFDVPGVSTLSLSPEAGGNYNATEGDRREKLLTTVMFDRNRFSPSDSAIGSMALSSDAGFTNCCAVVAELVEKDSGAKVKVVSVNLSQTNGTDYATLFDKLNQFKNERTILLFQSMDSAYHTPLKNQASSKLDKAYKYLGEYKVWPTYQFSYATTNCVSATATNPAPLSVPKSNGQASGVHTNQAYCATVRFEAEPQIEYGQLDMSAFSKKMDVTFSGYSGTTLTDFPVLVKLSTAISGFSYGDFQKTNGGDLRFADATGKLLPHEIDTWNSNGVSTVWVKVPSLTKDTAITACWGCAEPPEVAAKDVWDDDYVGVWHLGEAALPLVESSKTSTDFTTSKGSGIGFAAQGIVGGSVDFGASGNSRALLANDHAALDGFTKCTFEAWTYIDASLRGYKGGAQTNDLNKGLLAKRNSYSSECSYYLFDTGSATQFYVCQDGTSPASASSKVAAPSDAWTHQVYTFDGTSSSSNVEGWKNGVSAGKTTQAKTSIYAGSANLCLGNFQSGDARNFPGKIDEVRISKVARSAAWIKATHDTIADDAFATYAVEGAEPVEPDRILYVDVAAGATNTLDSALVTSYITNIVKQGSGTLVASAIPDYEGTFTLEVGVFSVGVKNGAGKHGYANSIYVGPGASLEFTGSEGGIFNAKNVVLEGAAAAGATGKFISNGGWYTIGSSMSFTLKSDAEFAACRNQRLMISSSTFDLGGKTLTVKNSGANQAQFDNCTFRNGGHVVVGSYMTFMTESGSVTFEQPSSGSPSVTLAANATFNAKNAVSALGWTLYATNNNTTVCGNKTRRPNDVNNSLWNGRLVLGGSSNIATHQGSAGGVTNTVFNVKGEVAGTGTLTVGPGWLNLHNAQNTYSGAVTVRGQSTTAGVIPPGGGGIGLWNGAKCFPNASSITFTNTARLAFMDATACTVPNVKFIAIEGEPQSVSGGVHTARSTMAGFVKEGAGTLYFDAAVDVTGLGDVKSGTLKVANRINLDNPADQAEALASTTAFSNLQFAAGTKLDLCDAPLFQLGSLSGSPSVTTVGVVGVSGKWTLTNPDQVMNVYGEGIELFGGNVSGGLAFLQGATFDLADEAAFTAAATAAGDRGILVAYARWVVIDEFAGIPAPMPQPSANISPRWQMYVDPSNVRELRLRLAPTSGYAAWIAGKGITGSDAAADKVTNGIANGVRYAFDIDPVTSDVGTPIIQVVRDAAGNPAVQARELAEGRDDVTFGILATPDLTDWSNATLVPMTKFATDGLWRPTASESAGYVFPAKMFFKYSIEIQ